jgi:hypothetical protein
MSAATFARCKRGESQGRKSARGVQCRQGMTSFPPKHVRDVLWAGADDDEEDEDD